VIAASNLTGLHAVSIPPDETIVGTRTGGKAQTGAGLCGLGLPTNCRSETPHTNKSRISMMEGMGGMLGMGIFWLLVLIVLILAIAALVKYLMSGGRK